MPTLRGRHAARSSRVTKREEIAMKYHDQLTLTELWTRALQELDALHEEAQRTDVGLSATDLNTLSRALAALRQDGPLSSSAIDSIGWIQAFLDAAIVRETLGHQNVFDGKNDPELGAIGRVRSAPILSKNGRCLDLLLQRFKKVLAMRDILAARVDAELQIARLKAA